MQTVHINGKWLRQRFTGVQRYSEEIATRIVKADDIHFVLHVPKGAPVPAWAEEAGVEVRIAPISGALFDQLYLPLASRGQYLLNFGGIAPVFKRLQLATFHDAAPFRFPKTHTRLFVAVYFVAFFVVSRIARQLATVSDFSRGELAGFLRVDPSRFLVVPCGADSFDPADVQRPDVSWADRNYLIVGTVAHHKNVMAPARALAQSGRHVVVVGVGRMRPGDYAAKIFADADMSFGDGVTLTERLTDNELRWLYRNATALVFPSLYEGFGLPVLEAQVMGCPVIASTAASIPEVAGDGALFFDPHDTADLLRQLDEFDTNPAAADTLTVRGTANAERFSWQGSAERLLGWIRSVA